MILREKLKFKLPADLIWVIQEHFPVTTSKLQQMKLQRKGTFYKVIPHPAILENKDVKEMPYLYPPHPLQLGKETPLCFNKWRVYGEHGRHPSFRTG